MKNRFLAALAAFITALGLSLSIGAAPAQAADGGLTSYNTISFYQWTNFGAQVANDRWQTSYYNVINQGGCLNIAGNWANGTARNNNTASLMFRTSGTAYAGYYLRVYDGQNCNQGGFSRGIGYLGGDGYTKTMSNLNDWYYNMPYSGSIKMYHTASSIKIYDPLG